MVLTEFKACKNEGLCTSTYRCGCVTCDWKLVCVFIMEFSPLGTLRNLLDASPQAVTSHLETQLRIAGNVASAMSHLHSAGIRHEDLRSSNVVLFGQANRVVKAKVTEPTSKAAGKP